MEYYRGELLFDGKVLQYDFDEKTLVVHMYHGEGHDLFWDDGPAGVSYMLGPKELPCDRLETRKSTRLGSTHEHHPQPRRRGCPKRNHISINARGGE